MPGPIRTALIGFGTAGRVFHAPFLAADPAYSLDVVVTSSPDRAAEVGRLHPGAEVVGSVDDLWQRLDRVDLVVVASPPDSHHALAAAALDQGVAVVVDKPLAPTAAEAEDLLERAKRSGAVFTVFQNRRWDGDFLTLRQLLADGALGDVRTFESRFEWWKPVPSKAWKGETPPSRGGGILFDLGTHLVDQAVQLFGPVASWQAELTSYRTPGVDDDAFVSLLHDSGVRSRLWMNGMAAQAGPRFHVLGSESAWTSWGLDPQEGQLADGMAVDDPRLGVRSEEAWGSVGVDGATRRTPMASGRYAAFYAALAGALRDGGPLPVDPADAVVTIRLIEQIHAAVPVRRG